MKFLLILLPLLLIEGSLCFVISDESDWESVDCFNQTDSGDFNCSISSSTSSAALPSTTTAEPEPICDEDQFLCSDDTCIPDWWACDGWPDCSSDELDCDCNGFKCDSGDCIDSQWECDGSIQCPDGSDEANCICGEDEFDCGGGVCINPIWVCDFVVDCYNNADEEDCDYTMTSGSSELELK